MIVPQSALAGLACAALISLLTPDRSTPSVAGAWFWRCATLRSAPSFRAFRHGARGRAALVCDKDSILRYGAGSSIMHGPLRPISPVRQHCSRKPAVS